MNEKKKYSVYRITTIGQEGGIETSSERFIGSTFAVSEAKAVSNVRFRTGGGYTMYEDDYGSNYKIISYRAEVAI